VGGAGGASAAPDIILYNNFDFLNNY